MQMITHGRQETIALGEKLGRLLPGGSLVALRGDLASGKTTLTKGIGKALGIKETINSPTFTILKIYEGTKTLYHIDAYRLYENDYDLGFAELLEEGGIIVIEWSDYIPGMFEGEYLEIAMAYIDEDERSLDFLAHGQKYEDIIEELKTC